MDVKRQCRKESAVQLIKSFNHITSLDHIQEGLKSSITLSYQRTYKSTVANIGPTHFTLLFIILVTLLLSGCSTSLVVPREVSGRQLYEQFELSGPCGLDRSGTRYMPEGEYDVIIGNINEIQRGPDPIPCVRVKQWRFVNGIRWDLAHPVVQARLDRGETINRAELETRYLLIENEYVHWEGSLGVIRLATAPSGGDVRQRHDRDPGVLTDLDSFPGAPWVIQLLIPPSIQRRDVTDLVRGWMDGSISNYGIIFDSSEFGLGGSVERRVVRGVQMRLVLYFDPPA